MVETGAPLPERDTQELTSLEVADHVATAVQPGRQLLRGPPPSPSRSTPEGCSGMEMEAGGEDDLANRCDEPQLRSPKSPKTIIQVYLK